jgi:hypothetical protein
VLRFYLRFYICYILCSEIEQAKKLYARRDDILAQAKTKQVTQVCEAWISRVMKSEEEVQELETKYKKEKRQNKSTRCR